MSGGGQAGGVGTGTTGPDAPTDAEDAVAALESAATAYRDAEAAVDEYGRESLETLRERYRTARDLLVGYQDSATDTGAQEFVNFAQFQGQFTTHVEGLDDDLPRREAFEAALEAVDKTRLSEDDFARALEALEPASDLAERLDDAAAARDRLAEAISDARARRRELQSAAEHSERLIELGEADLDAPLYELREPIERWNASVREAFEDLRTDAPARELFALLERAERYPLVDLRSPPDRVVEYVETSAAGEESVARLLEYADFSRSKLAHYVPDADAFRRAVATERTALERLDAEPLTVSWPPPPAAEVPWLVRELRGVAGGIVDDEAVAALRDLRRLATDEQRYGRLRDAAVATERLDADDRDRLASGAVEDDLADQRAAIERIEAALAEAPEV